MSDICIVIPVYKVEAYLHRCVDSILAQSYQNFEVILINDGSPDNSGKICDEYAQKDPRIHVIHQENGGLSAARNAGIEWAFKFSDSNWITFIDSDDWIHKQYLESLLNAVETCKKEIGIVGYKNTRLNEENNKISVTFQVFDTEEFFEKDNINAIIACGKLFKKALFKSIRFPLGKLFEDEYTIYKILFDEKSIVYVDAPLYYYYINEQSIINSPWNNRRLDIYDALEEQIRFFKARSFDRAERVVIRRYLLNVHEKETLFKKDPKLRRYFKNKKRKYFSEYAKELTITDDRDAWVLTQVFPFEMKVYWKYKAAVSHFRKTRS